MQFKIVFVPATGDVDAEEELNRFLRSHRAVSVQKELVRTDSSVYWSFCIEYLHGAPGTADRNAGRRRVDYKEVLSESDFAVFAQLREVRKRLAADEAIPVYAVCTNQQLAEMAKSRPATVSDLKRIEGFGDAKTEKYGEAFLTAMREHGKGESEQEDATSGESD